MGLFDSIMGLFGASKADVRHAAGLRMEDDALSDFYDLNDAITEGWLKPGAAAASSGDAAAQRDALRRALPTLKAMARLLDADVVPLVGVLGGTGYIDYNLAVESWLEAGKALLAGDWESCKASMATATQYYDRAFKEIAGDEAE